MRKIITFATILGFIVTLSLNVTTTAKGSEDEFKIAGRVTAIEKDVIKLEEPNGEIFTFAAKNDEQLEGIRVGDMVSVKYQHGRVDSIKEIKGDEMRKYAKRTSVVPVEIEGQVTKISGNTLTVTDGADGIFRVKAADPKTLEEIQVGDIVRVEGIEGQKRIVQPQKNLRIQATSIQKVEANPITGDTFESAPAAN
jgi:hypothetical protein